MRQKITKYLPLLALMGVFFMNNGFAQDLMMVRSKQAFPETMTDLQNAIIKHGYKISRIQRVDIGLTKAKYKTDKYRVVFFGKQDEIEKISRDYPDIIAYLPLKISIFAEGEQTLVVGMNPEKLSEFYPQAGLQLYFKRWKHDYQSIFDGLVK